MFLCTLRSHEKRCRTKRKFIKWFIDDQLCNAASGAIAAISPQGLAYMRRMCSSPLGFFQSFARQRTSDEEEECSLLQRVGDKVKDNIDAHLKLAGDKKAADLLAKVCMNQFDLTDLFAMDRRQYLATCSRQRSTVFHASPLIRAIAFLKRLLSRLLI